MVKIKRSFVVIVVLLSIVLSIAACSPKESSSPDNGSTGSQVTGDVPGSTDNEPAPSTDVKIIRIEAYNFGFTVDGPQINKGDKVKVIVTSKDGTHGVAIPGLNINLAPVAPGEEKSAEFTADQAGSFDYFCNVPCGSGHRSMKGTITVN